MFKMCINWSILNIMKQPWIVVVSQNNSCGNFYLRMQKLPTILIPPFTSLAIKPFLFFLPSLIPRYSSLIPNKSPFIHHTPLALIDHNSTLALHHSFCIFRMRPKKWPIYLRYWAKLHSVCNPHPWTLDIPPSSMTPHHSPLTIVPSSLNILPSGFQIVWFFAEKIHSRFSRKNFAKICIIIFVKLRETQRYLANIAFFAKFLHAVS